MADIHGMDHLVVKQAVLLFLDWKNYDEDEPNDQTRDETFEIYRQHYLAGQLAFGGEEFDELFARELINAKA